MGFNTVVYPGSSFFAASWGIKKVMEEIYHKGDTTAFLDKVREVEAYYYRDILARDVE